MVILFPRTKKIHLVASIPSFHFVLLHCNALSAFFASNTQLPHSNKQSLYFPVRRHYRNPWAYNHSDA
ncbi:hypothetical protein BDU57DRAFT_121159 [Ampelomyces quisqualis]|uniref:Uncharacterized protein n=1 Tax=Ampelomyces quisqualis TaxID=50730 RepID=A0A6A5QTV2_AMPQU|nr:hypothetical protein BDU57DRAFT_121159 [Ampelomyces quisqualis]